MDIHTFAASTMTLTVARMSERMGTGMSGATSVRTSSRRPAFPTNSDALPPFLPDFEVDEAAIADTVWPLDVLCMVSLAEFLGVRREQNALISGSYPDVLTAF